MEKMIATEHKPISTFRRLFYTLAVFGIATIVFYLIVYFQSKIWQALIPPIFILVGFAVTPVAVANLRREQTHLAGAVMIVALAVAYSGNEVVWKGLTIYHAAGGILLILLSGGFILPRQWRIWVSISVFYLVATLLINQFEPIPRVDQTSLPLLLPYIIGASLLLSLALILQLLLEIPIHSIRVRLIGTFLILVVVPVALTGTVAMLINAQNSQKAVLRQLESVASLKESAVLSWANNLQSDLDTIASGSINIDRLEILVSPGSVEDIVFQNTYNQLMQQVSDQMRNTNFFSEVMVADLAGTVVFSTESSSQGKSVKGESFFSPGLEKSVLMPPVTREGQGNILFVARPLKDNNDQTIAVLAGRANLEQLNKIMTERIGLGDTGETYLVNQSHHLITDSLFSNYKAGVSYVFSPAIDLALYKNQNGSGSYASYRVKYVLGVYRWIPELGLAFFAEQERSEALRSTFQGIYINIGLMIAALLVAFVVGYAATNRITEPLARLTKTAEQIASGNFQLLAETEQFDEIGALSNSFNSMTTQLRNLVTNLEQRVVDRTRDLERRSKQLQIAAEVAREATAVHDLTELLRRGVNLIHDRFGYYHVGIYLVDDLGEQAVLMAATGDAGRIMLARGERVRVGETRGNANQPTVGYVAQSGRQSISIDVSADPIHFSNPLLPETKSEAVLPLKVGAKVIGVIDVQSKETGSFDEETSYVLQIVSDQLAIAIQNTRLIEEMARRVEELQRLYGTYTQASWKTYQQRASELTGAAGGQGYRYRRLEIEPVMGEIPLIKEAIQIGQPVLQEPENIQAKQGDGDASQTNALAVPIKVRGQTIGAIEVQFSGQPLTSEVVATYEEIASRLALVLENARLLQDAQSLARREQQINVLSSRIRNTINLDAILQNTVRELGKAFDSTRTFIHLGVNAKASDDHNGADHPDDGDNRTGREEEAL